MLYIFNSIENHVIDITGGRYKAALTAKFISWIIFCLRATFSPFSKKDVNTCEQEISISFCFHRMDFLFTDSKKPTNKNNYNLARGRQHL